MIESLHKVMALLTYEVDLLGRTKKVTDAQAHYQEKCEVAEWSISICVSLALGCVFLGSGS